MTRSIYVDTDPLNDRLDAQGYAYLDDECALVETAPDRGWYVSPSPDGTPTAVRLTDRADDPYVSDRTAHVRTDHEPALVEEVTADE